MKTSAGILLYRKIKDGVEVFLVHPGGPFWKNKDLGAWSIPKGEAGEGEDLLDVAKREFREETGASSVTGTFIPLNPIRLKSGKEVLAWAVEGDIEAGNISSNTFSLQWPPNTGKYIQVPEVDGAAWFAPDEAKRKLNPQQVALIEELLQLLAQL